MSVSYIGEVALEKLLHQPESRFGIARDGTVRATEVYVCRTSAMRANVSAFAGAAHPEIPYLGVDDVEGEEMDGGLSRVVVKFAGYDSSGNAATGGMTQTFAVRRTVSTEPIETHPKLNEMTRGDRAMFKGWWDTWEKDGTLSAEIGSAFAAGNLAAYLLYYKLRGAESWYCPRVELVRTSVFNARLGFPRKLNVGKIDTPPPGFPRFTGRNALYKGHEEEVEGHATRIVESWEVSGPLLWDAFLYGDAPAPPVTSTFA